MNKFLVFVVISFLFILQACSPNNVTVDEGIKKYFDSSKVEGCFALLNNGTGDFNIYNLPRYRDSSFTPASTFKIVNALIGIETGRVNNEKTVIPWDKKIRIFPNGDTATAWNKDLTVAEAFKVSSVPVFQQIARSIGKDTMQRWLDSLSYGTKTIKGPIDSFWLNNSIKIKPDEQLGLVKKLYFGQLPFQKRTQDIVKKMMLQEQNANYQLFYKSGWGFKENGKSLLWTIGWIEENHHVYFFVLNFEADKGVNVLQERENLLKRILTNYGFFQGKK